MIPAWIVGVWRVPEAMRIQNVQHSLSQYSKNSHPSIATASWATMRLRVSHRIGHELRPSR